MTSRLVAGVTALCFWAGMAMAQTTCAGTDLRPSLTESERAALTATLGATPYAEGNHWRATKGDTTLHIVGTMHLADPRHASTVERLQNVLDRAGALFVEAGPEEEAQLQAAMTQRPELAFLVSGPTLPEMLDEDTWQVMSDAMSARGIPPVFASKMQPWYASLLLSMPACMMPTIMEGNAGLDKLLVEEAQARGLPVQALEPYDTLFRLMGSDPIERQVELLSLGILPEPVIEDSMHTLANAYFEEQPLLVMEIGRIVAQRHVDLPPGETAALFDEMLGSLLDMRNIAWMETLRDMPAGLSVVAVGAGHLPGENGVLRLLEKEGYTLERLPF